MIMVKRIKLFKGFNFKPGNLTSIEPTNFPSTSDKVMQASGFCERDAKKHLGNGSDNQ